MSSLNSISSSGAASPVACKRPTDFEVNSKEFGPVAASAISAAARATDAASSTVSLSTDGLKRLADDIGEAWDGAVNYVEDAVDGVENGIAHLGHEAADAVALDSSHRGTGLNKEHACSQPQAARASTGKSRLLMMVRARCRAYLSVRAEAATDR